MDIHNNYGYPEMNYGYPEMNYGYPYFFRYPKFIFWTSIILFLYWPCFSRIGPVILVLAQFVIRMMWADLVIQILVLM